MIQIDDAGWGCLVGGVFLGIYREETGEYAYREIPVSIFYNGNFTRKAYLKAAYQITPRLLDALKVPPDELITVCTGEVLTGVRQYLTEHGYNWKPGKITGPLQEKIETTLLKKLNQVGIKVDYKTLTEKQGLLFWHCVRWLKGGNLNGKARPDREKLCKTGWSTFRIWADMPYSEARKASKSLKASLRRERLEQYFG